jgi:hypothetical protein
MSGNTDFWHNDLFNRIGHPVPGNNLFGAERLQNPQQLVLDIQGNLSHLVQEKGPALRGFKAPRPVPYGSRK